MDRMRRGVRLDGRRVPRRTMPFAAVFAATCLWLSPAFAQAQKPQPQPPSLPVLQLASPPKAATSGPPAQLTLAEALERAQKNSPQFQAAVTAAKLAHEDQVQASAAMKPSFSYLMQYLNTQGNGISPVGRFVTNDGIHVYRAWLVARENMPGSFFIDAGPRRAGYLKALADAEQEIARRGLAVTVTRDYYALVAAQRDYATAQVSLKDARHFLAISQALEKGGEVAHTDVIRFQLQVGEKQRALENARLARSTARLNLAVLLFPTLNENFRVRDDLNAPPSLPTIAQVEGRAKMHNPVIRAALAAYHASGVDVSAAKSAFYPSLGIEFDYGIEANALQLHSVNLTRPGVVQPNLGYFVTYSLNMPIWDWGSMWSKLHQAEDRQQLAKVNLSYAQREVLNHLYSFYNQAAVTWNQLSSLERSVTLANRNLQLVTMQYKAGETTVLQVLDAENSLVTARNNYVAGAAQYRNALAQLQTITGSF
jgi:outer membrane protein TolC